MTDTYIAYSVAAIAVCMTGLVTAFFVSRRRMALIRDAYPKRPSVTAHTSDVIKQGMPVRIESVPRTCGPLAATVSALNANTVELIAYGEWETRASRPGAPVRLIFSKDNYAFEGIAPLIDLKLLPGVIKLFISRPQWLSQL